MSHDPGSWLPSVVVVSGVVGTVSVMVSRASFGPATARPAYSWSERKRVVVMQRDLRASDAEREKTVQTLQHALGEGRITMAEFEERVATAYAARTRAELDVLTADLPRSLW
jgi:Flp pilus assembly protein CpaB